MEFSCTELCNSKDNLLSYSGLVDERISASEKDLPLLINPLTGRPKTQNPKVFDNFV